MLRLSPVEVWRGPQRSDSALRLSPVEVRRGPLRSRAGGGGPARPTAIKSWQMRSGEEEEGGRRRKEEEEEEDEGAGHLT